MSIILWVFITTVILFTIFHLSKTHRIKQEEKNRKDEVNHQSKERMVTAQKKFHEEEKKRWENEYWKRHGKGER